VDRLADVVQRREEGAGFDRYRDDPVAFCVEVLGFEPWSRQRDILEAIAKHDRVAVRSGQGIGKTTACGAAALWWWSTRGPGCRVIVTASTGDQLRSALWDKGIRRLYHSAKRPLPGKCALLPWTGVTGPEGQQIIGLTADSPEAISGIRAEELLIIVDEASGVEHIWDAVEGNLSGGGKLVCIGNPTHNVGFFYECFHTKGFERLHVSALESPNVVAGTRVVPGVSGREWVEERKREWGEASPMYRIRVLGEFAEGEEGCIFPTSARISANERWIDTKPEGRLCIGVDPAGDSGTGDESAFAVRRGMKVVSLTARSGLRDDAHVSEVLGLIVANPTPGEERPCLVVDRDGPVGARVWGCVLTYLQMHEGAFDAVGFRSGAYAVRQPNEYERGRDELWGSCAEWVRSGGAYPLDVKLDKELSVLQWLPRVSGKVKVTPKEEIRKLLGRSPDRADAFALSCWRPSAWQTHQITAALPDPPRSIYDEGGEVDNAMDPYGGDFTDPRRRG